MRILVTAVFEQLVYHCTCIDDRDPAHPRLEVDAILRDGDADGPLLLPVADYKRMAGFDTADARLPAKLHVMSIFLSVGVSILVGMGFGLYPAWRAAKLDPIEALRHE